MNPQEKNAHRVKKCDKEYIKKLDYTNVSFPVAQKDYRKIEVMNNINVFGYEKQEPYPVHISKEKFDNISNLLLITNGNNTISSPKTSISSCTTKQNIK